MTLRGILYACTVFLLLRTTVLAQIHSCQKNESQQIAFNSVNATQNSALNDSMVSQYIPNAAMPSLNFKVNFVFLKHPTQPHYFSGISQNQLLTDAANLVSLINSWFQTSGSIPSNMVPQQPGPTVANPKISIQLNQVYINTTTLAVANSYFGSPVFYNTFPHDTANVLNLYFYTETDPGDAGAGWAENGKFCSFSLPAASLGGAYIPGTIFNNPRLVWHELGHALGFLDDNYGGGPSNNDPIFGGYRPNDATYDLPGGYNCSIPTGVGTPTNANNNLMGNSPCREVLSAKQIAAFHYLVAINKTRKFTQFNNLPYPYIPYQGAPIKMVLSGTQTLTSLPSNQFDSIIIPNKADIFLQNINLTAKPNARIIIERGGRLRLKRVNISCANNNAFSWQGIEVWGDPDATQDMSLQGWLEMANSNLSGANIAVCAGRKTSSDEPDNKYGGGVIIAENTSFQQNHVDVFFTPYRDYNRNPTTLQIKAYAPYPNKSCFTRCQFETNGSSIQLKQACVILKHTEGVQFKGCKFNSLFFGAKVNYGIYSLSSGFIVEKSDTLRSQFIGFKNAIAVKSHQSNIRVRIENAKFGGMTHNAVLMTNVQYPAITSCTFDLVNYQPDNQPTAGIYLNNCFGYVVENNHFVGMGASNTTVMPSGIYVRQSGPYANSIYNNRFQGLNQALWSVGQNLDPENSNTGLLLNCNDFINCVYNIGVTKTYRLSEDFDNYAGIADVQGVASTPDETDNVRNTYDAGVCVPYDENKFNINTNNDFFVDSHGSFWGAAFRPSSQANNTCSNAVELVDIIGPSPANATKVSYCPLDVLKNMSTQDLNQRLIDEAQSINGLSQQLTNLTDGGNTQTLLNAINNYTDFNALKTLLTNASPYLSDTALTTYFLKNGLPVGHIVDIHDLNKPVSKKVWQVILNLNLSAELMIQLKQQQFITILSPLNFMKARWKLYSTHLGLSCHEKMRRLLSNTTYGSVDSVFQLLNSSGINYKLIHEINSLTSLERYQEANQLLFTLNTSNDKLLADYQFLQIEYIESRRSELKYQKLKQDIVKRNRALAIRNSGNFLAEGIASFLLDDVWGMSWIDEEKPVPVRPYVPPPPPNPIGIAENSLLGEYIAAFPNPTEGVLHLQYKKENSHQATKIKVYDVSGTLVLEKKIEHELQDINMSALKSGLYFLSLSENETTIGVMKIVKY